MEAVEWHRVVITVTSVPFFCTSVTLGFNSRKGRWYVLELSQHSDSYLPKDNTRRKEEAPISANSPGLGNLFIRNIDAQTAEGYLKTDLYYSDGNWRLPPSKTYDAGTNNSKDDRLQQWFMDVINDIIDYSGFSATRKALATQSINREPDENLSDESSSAPPCPDFVLLGQDDRQLPRRIDTYSPTMGMSKEGTWNLYRGCVSFGKVEHFGTQDLSETVLKDMSAYARYAL